MLFRDVAPVNALRDEHGGEAEQCDNSRIDMMDAARCPEHEAGDEDDAEDLLLAAHSAHRAEFFLRERQGLRRFREFRLDDLIEQVRRDDREQQARDDADLEPGHPAQGLAKGLFRQRIREDVVRSTSQENAGRSDDGCIGTVHQECARALVLARLGITAEDRRDTVDDRVDDAAATSRVRRRERSDDEICCAHDISDAQRILAEAREQQVSDALAEARLDEARSKHEGGYDQPDRAVRETFQRLASFHDAEYRQQCAGDDGDGTKRQRLQDEASDRRDEDGEQAPGLRADTSRCRDAPDDCSDGHTDQAPQQVIAVFF